MQDLMGNFNIIGNKTYKGDDKLEVSHSIDPVQNDKVKITMKSPKQTNMPLPYKRSTT